MIPVSAYAAQSADAPLGPFAIQRRQPGPGDVHIEIQFCGVCHSDLHIARGEWEGFTVYPVVPGHEIVGRVVSVGSGVKKFKKGDLAAVGCLVGSCHDCPSCAENLEQYCQKGMVLTYNSPDAHMPGTMTYGGYSTQIVVDERFVLRVPASLDPAGGRAAAVRRHHDVFAAAALERRSRQESRHRRARRSGPHGREAGARDGRAHRAVHDLAR